MSHRRPLAGSFDLDPGLLIDADCPIYLGLLIDLDDP
jgi:hypothetical protein